MYRLGGQPMGEVIVFIAGGRILAQNQVDFGNLEARHRDIKLILERRRVVTQLRGSICPTGLFCQPVVSNDIRSDLIFG